MTIAGVITLIACYFVAGLMEIQLLEVLNNAPKYSYEFTKIFVIGFLCVAIYTGLNLLFKMEYASELTKRIIEKFKK